MYRMEKTEKLIIIMSQWPSECPLEDRGMREGWKKKDYAGGGKTQTERE